MANDVTSLTLLERMRRSDRDDEAWWKFDQLYRPLLLHYLKNAGCASADRDELIQRVYLSVYQRRNEFQHGGRTGSFRCWLRTICVSRVCDFYREVRRTQARADMDTILERLQDPHSDPNHLWDSEHDQFVLREAHKIMQNQLPERERAVIRLLLLEERSAKEVAQLVQVSLAEVYRARDRGLKALSELLADFIDE